MRTKAVIFDKPFHAVYKGTEIDSDLKTDGILMKTLYSLVSAGTEGAICKGTESWAPLPYNPGYAAVGEVLEMADAVKGFKKGDMIFCYSKHSGHSNVSSNDVIVKVPREMDYKTAVFTRLAAVSITALRVSPPELGDTVAVIGMGLVGNLAAQLFSLSGARVICVDICDKRLELAGECGLPLGVNPSKVNLRDAIMELTGGKGASSVIEATGVPASAEQAFSIAAKAGDVVLLGSPRGKHEGNITDLLNKVHLWGNGCVSLKGAHEWRYPLKPSEGCRHSIQRNCEIILELIRENKLKVKPLITHVVSPENCQEIYDGLLNHKEKYTGVVFDWKNL